MRRATLTLVLLAAMLIAAPAAQAAPRTFVTKFDDVVFTDPPAGLDCIAFATFSISTPSGTALGSGSTCLTGGDFACFPVAFAGCKQTALATFTLGLPGGSVRAEMTLREIFTSESALVQIGAGRIVGGTGAFAGARGFVAGAGPIAFTDAGIDANLTYVIHVR